MTLNNPSNQKNTAVEIGAETLDGYAIPDWARISTTAVITGYIVGPGGSGGSGKRGPDGTIRAGGSAGGGGMATDFQYKIADLYAVVDAPIGSELFLSFSGNVGTPGLSVTINNTNGNNATSSSNGVLSVHKAATGTRTALAVATCGLPGVGGTNVITSGGAGGNNSSGQYLGGGGGQCTLGGPTNPESGNGGVGQSSACAAGGGGGGAGLNAANIGGPGGFGALGSVARISSVSKRTPSSRVAYSHSISRAAGAGGGGGSSDGSSSLNGGGGWRGGGGGGGAASKDGTPSGAGQLGGKAYIYFVITD